MKELKKQFYLRWDEFLFILIFEFVFFAFGEILLWCVTDFAHEDTILELGTLMTLIVTTFVLIFFGTSMLSLCFNTGVCMGSTRKRLMPAFFAFTFLECMCAAAFAFLLHHLELWILNTFYVGMENEFAAGQCFHLKYILTVSLAITALNAILGTLFLKFGKIAFIISWVLWMFCFTALPRIARVLPDYKDTIWGRACLNIISNITEGRLIAAAIVLSVGLLLTAWILLRRQQVKL